jgi:DNA modification methylase
MISTRLLVGHVLDRLAELPDESVHCCVTSPPYYGLRDYGLEPQVWEENDPACQHSWGEEGKSGQRNRNVLGNLNGCSPLFLHPSTGAFCQWCGAWCGSLGLEPTPELYIQHLVEIFAEVRRILRSDGTLWLNIGDSYARDEAKGQHKPAFRSSGGGLKPKDLIGIPWMLAFALRGSGWWLRQDIIWSKPNAMPESVTDRCTKAHEYLFLLTKSERYFYDSAAIQEPAEKGNASSSFNTPAEHKLLRSSDSTRTDDDQRNKRSVWTVPTRPFTKAHFAVFPPNLITPCIQAGTSEHGVCQQCGAPWKREVSTTTTGWSSTCKCNADIIPATVLDPFFGAGTTGLVCQHLWRSCIGIDLSDKYAEIGKDRMPGGLLYNLEVHDDPS